MHLLLGKKETNNKIMSLLTRTVMLDGLFINTCAVSHIEQQGGVGSSVYNLQHNLHNITYITKQMYIPVPCGRNNLHYKLKRL